MGPTSTRKNETMHLSIHSILSPTYLRPLLVLAMIGGLTACEGDLGNASSGGTHGSTGSMSATGGDDGGNAGPCSADAPCPSGQFCFNGLCAIGCNTNADCASDQYCDTTYTHTCQNKDVPQCTTDMDCGPDQVCVSGFCGTKPDTGSCDPNGLFVGDDGCSEDALCLEDIDTEGQTACYTFPPCAEHDTCPVGTQGAVCNVDLLPNKGRICLVGMCTGGEHCPSNWSCAIPTNQTLGVCSPGTPGSPCVENANCSSGVCQLVQPGSLGFCA